MAADTVLPISGLTSLQAGSFIYRMAKDTDAGEQAERVAREIEHNSHIALAIVRDVLVYHNTCQPLAKLDKAIFGFGGEEMLSNVKAQYTPFELIPDHEEAGWAYSLKFVHDIIQEVGLATILAQWCDEMVEAIAALNEEAA